MTARRTHILTPDAMRARTQAQLDVMVEWATANGFDAFKVTASKCVEVFDSPDGPFIGFHEFVYDAEGRKRFDPDGWHELLTQWRTVPLVAKVPEGAFASCLQPEPST